MTGPSSEVRKYRLQARATEAFYEDEPQLKVSRTSRSTANINQFNQCNQTAQAVPLPQGARTHLQPAQHQLQKCPLCVQL